MPAKSRAQAQFFRAELGRKRSGQKTKTGLAEATIEDFAATRTADLPQHVTKKRKKA